MSLHAPRPSRIRGEAPKGGRVGEGGGGLVCRLSSNQGAAQGGARWQKKAPGFFFPLSRRYYVLYAGSCLEFLFFSQFGNLKNK